VAGADGGGELRVGFECVGEAFESGELGFEVCEFESVAVFELLCVIPPDEGWGELCGGEKGSGGGEGGPEGEGQK
jgi:hypothetical protein